MASATIAMKSPEIESGSGVEGDVVAVGRGSRAGIVDAIRGFAVVIMVVYHFCFDLNHFGVLNQNMNDSMYWLSFRGVIVTLFTTLVGVSLVLASGRGSTKGFWRRQGKLAICAAVVSISSYVMFPKSFIFMGVLHFIFLASFLALPLVKFPRVSLLLGLISLSAGLVWSNEVFNWRPLQWVGFMTYKPFTEDYVPLFPWIGLVLIGIFIGHEWLKRGRNVPAPEVLTFLGRHSLVIYMIHQPIMIGLLTVLFAVI